MEKLNYDNLSTIFNEWELIKAAKASSGDSQFDATVVVNLGMMRRAAGTFESVEELTRGVNNIAQGKLHLHYNEGDKQRIGSFSIGQIKEINRPKPDLLASAKAELQNKEIGSSTKQSAIKRV